MIRRLVFALLMMHGIHGFSQGSQPVKVMLLGTYHMVNPGLDMANMKADDVTTAKRQAELEDLAILLAEFQPTKIAIEASYGDSIMVKRYLQYIEHKNPDSLKANEIYQIGFRLAAKLNHTTIHPVDYRLNIQPESLEQLMANHPDKAQYMQAMMTTIQDSISNWENILYKKTISEFLAFMNSNLLVELSHSLYLDMTKELWAPDNYGGAKMLSLWYERNVMIFQNLIRITDFDNPEERILVIFGQGHSKILRDLFQDAAYYEDVEVIDYLLARN